MGIMAANIRESKVFAESLQSLERSAKVVREFSTRIHFIHYISLRTQSDSKKDLEIYRLIIKIQLR